MRARHNFCFVQLLDPFPEDNMFSKNQWPHHITLAGVFALNSDYERIISETQQLTTKTKPFDVKVASYGELGWGEERIRVALLERAALSVQLHEELVNILQTDGAVFKQPSPLGEEFNPHISNHGQLERFAVGAVIQISQVSLVDLAPGGDKTLRKVLCSHELGNSVLT